MGAKMDERKSKNKVDSPIEMCYLTLSPLLFRSIFYYLSYPLYIYAPLADVIGSCNLLKSKYNSIFENYINYITPQNYMELHQLQELHQWQKDANEPVSLSGEALGGNHQAVCAA